MNDHVTTFMALLTIGLAVFIVGPLVRNAYRWLEGKAAEDESGLTFPQLFLRGLETLRLHPWVLLLPLGVKAIELIGTWGLQTWRLRLLGQAWPRSEGLPWSIAIIQEALGRWWRWLTQGGMFEGLMSGRLFGTRDFYVALLLLLVAGVFLLRRRIKGAPLVGWGVLIAVAADGAITQMALVKSDQHPPFLWLFGLFGMVAQPATEALTSATILLLLRCLILRRPLSFASLAEEVAVLLPKWFCLLFLMALPMNLVGAIQLFASGGSTLQYAFHTAFLTGAWISALLGIALCFAPYALASEPLTAREAARRSLALWSQHSAQVLALLAPLWLVGSVVAFLEFVLRDWMKLFPQSSWQHWAIGLSTCVWSLWVVLAEVVCLQWYESRFAREPTVLTEPGISKLPTSGEGVES